MGKKKNKRMGLDQYMMKVERFIAVILKDREEGVTLWQILLMLQGDEENRFVITAQPEAFLTKLASGMIEDVQGCQAGILILPIHFGPTCSDAQMVGVLTLPRDQILTRADAERGGVTIDDFPESRWQEVLNEFRKY